MPPSPPHPHGSRASALLALEVCKVEHYPFSDDQEPTRADWELYIAEVAKNIMDEQSPKQLFLVSHFYGGHTRHTLLCFGKYPSLLVHIAGSLGLGTI